MKALKTNSKSAKSKKDKKSLATASVEVLPVSKVSAPQPQTHEYTVPVQSAVGARPCPDCPYKKQNVCFKIVPEQTKPINEYAPLPASAYNAPIKAAEPDRVYVAGKLISNK